MIASVNSLLKLFQSPRIENPKEACPEVPEFGCSMAHQFPSTKANLLTIILSVSWCVTADYVTIESGGNTSDCPPHTSQWETELKAGVVGEGVVAPLLNNDKKANLRAKTN